MSQFSKLRAMLTPKSGGVLDALLAFLIAFVIEMAKTVGQFITGVLVLVVFIAGIAAIGYSLNLAVRHFVG